MQVVERAVSDETEETTTIEGEVKVVDPAADQSTGQQDQTTFTTEPEEITIEAISPMALTLLTEQEQEPPQPQPGHGRWTPRKARIVAALAICFVLSGIASAAYLYWPKAPVATIYLTPHTQQQTFSLDFAGDMVTAKNATVSQQQTVAATGQGYQPASKSHGTIYLYNTNLAAVYVPAGTQLTGSDGVAVTTDAGVTIPAEVPPNNGEVWVSGHAAQTGPAGNIAAGDLYGRTSMAGVLADNKAFGGGQNAYSYTFIKAEDIQGVVTELSPQVQQQAHAALQGTLSTSEALADDPTCSVQTSTDHPGGAIATSVSVTLTERCQGEAYNVARLTALVEQNIGQQQMIGTPQVLSLAQSGANWQAKVSVATGIEISPQVLNALARKIAGKKLEQAQQILDTTPGILSARIELASGQLLLPADPNNINFDVFPSQ